MPLSQQDAQKLIARRHPDYQANAQRWQWLLDSLDGGAAYRDACYGQDSRGEPIRNLIRHKREYDPDDKRSSLAGQGQPDGYLANANDYEMRRTRTPVPRLVGRAVDRHLCRIFRHDVTRQIESDKLAWLTAWWEDVDGTGTPMDKFIRKELAPILFALGQVDVVVDHPPADPLVPILTRDDELKAGLDRVILGYLLPEHVLWWRLDDRRRYAEVLVQEIHEDKTTGQPVTWFRHWTATESTLYDGDGKTIRVIPHPYERPPIQRLFTTRSKRFRNVGESSYESIAEYQKNIYNRNSELILMDHYQAFPLVQAPEELLSSGTIAIGPSYILPMKGDGQGAYQGFQVVDFPQGGAESVRTNIDRDQDQADRDAALTKPAGATSGGTVAQSGISKDFDFQEGNDLLSERAETLAEAERVIVELVILVQGNGPVDPALLKLVKIAYPREFDLYTAEDLAALTVEIQQILAAAGDLPETTLELLTRLIRLTLPGLDETRYSQLDDEMAAFLADRAEAIEQGREAAAAALAPGADGSSDATGGGSGTPMGGPGGGDGPNDGEVIDD